MADRGFDWFGDEYLRRVDADIEREMHSIGRAGVQFAQSYAPVRTGELRQGISYEYDATTHTLSLVSAAPWSIFVEFGTYKMPARPYLRPALVKMAQALGGNAGVGGANLGMNFSNATPIKHPEVLAHPRNERHRMIMQRNRETSTAYNRSAIKNARQFIHHR